MAIKTSAPQIVKFKNVTLPIKNILRRIGYPYNATEIHGEMRLIFDEMVTKATNLIEPIGVYRIFKVATRSNTQISLQDTNFVIHSAKVAKLLRETDSIVLFMATIGPHLERDVETIFAQGEITRGFILDAIGSETADSVADKIHKEVIKKLAEEQGFHITTRFSPGYGDWSVTVQRELSDICGGKLIGISVNERSFMIPKKSVSAVLGWVKKR